MNRTTQTPELRALGEACRRLESAGLDYMLTGSQRQLEDVRSLLLVTHDAAYLAHWVAALNLDAVVVKARS